MRILLLILLLVSPVSQAEEWIWKEIISTGSDFHEYHGSAVVTEDSTVLLYHDDKSERGKLTYKKSGSVVIVKYETYETEREIMELKGVCHPVPKCKDITITNGWLTIVLSKVDGNS